MIKKISDKDKKDWQEFINSSEKLENKEVIKERNVDHMAQELVKQGQEEDLEDK